MEPLIHIVYVSTAKIAVSPKVLAALIKKSRTNNAARGITGLLLSSDGFFFQVIEGEQAIVERLFEKIKSDPRHHNLILIIKEAIEKRDFAHWTMELAEATAKELAKLPALQDSAHTASIMAEISEGRAKKLIQAFADGQ